MRALAGAAVAVVARPRLWTTAARQYRRALPTRWWRRSPHLPVPDAAYVRFRLLTQYGDPNRRAATPRDVVNYLAWCRQWERAC